MANITSIVPNIPLLLSIDELLRIVPISIALVAYVATVRARYIESLRKAKVEKIAHYRRSIIILTIADFFLIVASVLLAIPIFCKGLGQNLLPATVNNWTRWGMITLAIGLLVLIGLHFYQWKRQFDRFGQKSHSNP